MARHYLSYGAWKEAMIEAKDPESQAYVDLISIDGIGPKVSADLVAFFDESHNLKVLNDLLEKVTIRDEKPIQASSSFLANKTIVFTGTLQHMTRAEAKVRAESLGAKVSSSVSSKTDYVIIGTQAGLPKNKRCKETWDFSSY